MHDQVIANEAISVPYSKMAHPLEIRYRLVADLLPYASNAREHSKKQIGQIARSIERFGFNNPVLIDDSGGIIAGHGRVMAAKQLNMESIPTLCLRHLSAKEKRAYILADNKIALNATWNIEILQQECAAILEYEVDLDIDILDLGFSTGEIDVLMSKHDGNQPEDDMAKSHSFVAVSALDDLWQCGPHRVYCGDALKTDSFATLMDGKQASMVFTDPPYNVPIKGHVSGLGKQQHREFAMASGEMEQDAFMGFLSDAIAPLIEHSIDGSIHFICMDWRHLLELQLAAQPHYSELKNICVWNKSNGGMGSLYRSKHEMVLVYKAGTEPHINNVNLGTDGRYRTNVWDYAGMNVPTQERDTQLAYHPTVKPVALVADAIMDCSHRGNIILDNFLGSGTTLLAAEQTGRICYGMELDPLYVDTAIRRWQAQTHQEAIRLSDGQSFNDIEKQAQNAIQE